MEKLSWENSAFDLASYIAARFGVAMGNAEEHGYHFQCDLNRMPDFMKGLADGINKSKKYVEKAISGVADAMTLTMQSGLNVDMDGISGAMMNGGSGGVVNNYYNNDNSRTVNQTNNSPKSLSRLEIYRQTRNALNV